MFLIFIKEELNSEVVGPDKSNLGSILAGYSDEKMSESGQSNSMINTNA